MPSSGAKNSLQVAGSTNGWGIQRNVISALVYRELKTRVSEVRLGVLGVFIEPIGVMTVFLLIFSVLRGNNGPLDVALFLTAGIVLFTLFNDLSVRSLNAMRANEALFFYRPVKPIDTVIARCLVPLLVASYLGLALTSFGLGLLFMVAGHRYSSTFQIVPLVMRPLWFISGVFFSLASLPQWLRPWVSWNPVLQAIELSRHAFNSNYPLIDDTVSLPYLWAWAGLSCAIGLWVYRNNERILLTR